MKSNSSVMGYYEMNDRLNKLCEKYSAVSVTTLGTSLLGKRIPLVKLGDEASRGAVLYVATHHASEHICTEVLIRFIEEYCSMLGTNAKPYGVSLSNLQKSSIIYIVPMLNPDGVEINLKGAAAAGPLESRVSKMNGSSDFTHWQSNARGVDLNHNYNAGFEEYKELEETEGIRGGAPTRYSGEFPESEPEVGYLCNFIRFNSNIKAALTLHTQGEEIYYSSGGKTPPRGEILATLLSKMTGYTLSKAEGLASYGGMTDWMIQKINKPSFTLECGKGINPLPDECAFEIYTRLREALFTFPLMV